MDAHPVRKRPPHLSYEPISAGRTLRGLGGSGGSGGTTDGGAGGVADAGGGGAGGSGGATDGGAIDGVCQPTEATSCTMPGYFVAPGLGQAILITGDEVHKLEKSGVGEAWLTIGLSATNMNPELMPHVSVDFSFGVAGGDDYTLELYCTSCGGKLIDRSAHAPVAGGLEDAEYVSFYKGQTSPSGLTGERLYVHVLPVHTTTCATWSIVGFTEDPTTGRNCN